MLLWDSSIKNSNITSIISTIIVEIKSPFELKKEIVLFLRFFSIKRNIIESIKKILLMERRPKNMINAPKPGMGPMSDIIPFLSKYKRLENEY